MLANHPNLLGRGPTASSMEIGNVDGPSSSTDNAVVRWDGTTGRLIQNSTAILTDNGDLSLPSTATLGLQLYNTADQTTNYERLDILWTGNIATIQTQPGGAGSNRSLQLRARNSGGSTVAALTVSPAGTFSWSGAQFGVAGNNFTIASSHTGTSGSVASVAITPAYNQSSGTAANTDLLINRTETAVGSGAQYLAQMQVGGSDKFRVDNQGSAQTAGNLGFISKTLINSPSNGVLTIWNNAQSDFSRLQFGGTTSSFPALKRETNYLRARLADDSADASLILSGAVLTGAAINASAGLVSLGNGTQTTVGSAGGASALPATPTGYLIFKIASTQYVIPYYAQA